MKTNGLALALIKHFEGLETEAYLCPAGVWTIGYGHTGGGVGPGLVIDAARADELLRADLAHAEACVTRSVNVPLTRNQFGALVSFVFNLGCGAFRGSTLLRLLNAGKHDEVPAQLRRWVFAKGERLEGLARRREAEVRLWNTPDAEVP